MRSPAWYLARLKAMTPGEMFWRVGQMLQRRRRRAEVQKCILACALESVSERDNAAPLPPDGAFTIRFFDLELPYPGPVDWSRDYRSGVSAPAKFYGDVDYRDAREVGDVKMTWELNRHQFLPQWARAGGPDDVAGRAIAALIADWIRANPRYVGINWGSSLEAALRILSWGIALEIAKDSPALRDTRPAIAASVREQAQFIRTTLSLHSSANNHLMGELTGLLAAATFFPELPEAKAWGGFALRSILRETDRQVFADGVAREQAIYYHHYVAEYIATAIALMHRAGGTAEVPTQLLERLFRMIVVVHAATDDEGRPFEIGDTDDGAVTGLNSGDHAAGVYESLLWTGHRLFGAEEFAHHAAAIAQAAGREPAHDAKTDYWWGQLEAPLLAREVPAGPDFFFPEGGWFITRRNDGWQSLFKGGPFGYPSIAAHAHADQLSFQLRYGKADVLTDSGTYCYHTMDAWRRAFRGTPAHNTVTVDDRDQAEVGGAFLWSTHADATLTPEMLGDDFCVTGTHNGYQRLSDPVSHKRTLRAAPEGEAPGWTITDDLRGKRKSVSHDFELNWNVGPAVAVQLVGSDAETTSSGGAEFLLTARDMPDLLLTITAEPPATFCIHHGDDGPPPRAWWSRRYLHKQAILQISARTSGAACRLTTVIRLAKPPATAPDKR
ncbi:hypothetical protein CVU37_01340 [candidate division BRC1 bacterium HGW-BRC1-1]|nr:MAG: hypothetical protein CVU37_01340 [candidate division BRC1 bacterium HGW-BRC1-1]